MKRPLRGFRERRQADALQEALERFEAARRAGVGAGQARADAAPGPDELSRPFVLATSMADAAVDVVPDAAFIRRVAMQIRETPLPARPVARRAPARFRFTPLAAAAAVVAAAVVLIPSFGALPGEPLYAVKGAAEDARVWFARGPAEARMRLGLANTRFEEVEQLIENSRVRVMGGPGVLAAALNVDDMADPELARLIEGALRDAGEQLEAAAEILTTTPAPREDLDALVAVTTRGRALATDVAEELPNPEQPPVLRAAVKLAKIEAKAKAAQMTAEVTEEPTPEPCSTPSPTPSPSPTPPPSEATPSPSPSPTLTPGVDGTEATPSSELTASPSTTPCGTAEPSPSPSPSPASEGTDASTAPSPSGPADDRSTADDTDGGEQSSVSQEPQETHRRPLSPFGQQA